MGTDKDHQAGHSAQATTALGATAAEILTPETSPSWRRPTNALGAAELVALQRTAGNRLVSRWLSRGAAATKLQRLKRTPRGSTVLADVAIAGLNAVECFTYLRYLKEKQGVPPCTVRLGAAGDIEFAAGDDALLRARLAADLPNIVNQFTTLLAGDQPGLDARNVDGGVLDAAGAVQLVDDFSRDARVTGFADWLLSSAAKWIPRAGQTPAGLASKQDQRLNQLNELREAVHVLDRTGSANIGETEIPKTTAVAPPPAGSAAATAPGAGAAETSADVTVHGPAGAASVAEQTEGKTIVAPITRSADLMDQFRAGCKKFENAVSATNRVALYASYDSSLLPGLDRATGALGSGFVYDMPLRALNAANVLGQDRIVSIVARMENGPSFELTPTGAGGPWQAKILP